MDFNYTYSHSFDDSSGLQSDLGFGSQNNSGPFIENPIRQRSNYASSDFDIRHLINVSTVWQMPFGKGRAMLNTDSRALQALVGGWQLSGSSAGTLDCQPVRRLTMPDGQRTGTCKQL